MAWAVSFWVILRMCDGYIITKLANVLWSAAQQLFELGPC